MIHITIRIGIAGAGGRMGQEVVRLTEREPTWELVAAISPRRAGQQVRATQGAGPPGLSFVGSVAEALDQQEMDVLIDFTTHTVVQQHIQLALAAGVRPVVGTSGLNEATAMSFASTCAAKKLGCVIVPNFSLGAVLMMQFAAQAARYFPQVEIIESHHEKKTDAPSGTAIKLAEQIAAQRPSVSQGHPAETELLPGARGAEMSGLRIHSIRLPGFFSHHEVLLGEPGQLLTLRHDALHEIAFMPGVQLAVEKVMELEHCVYGLEKLLSLDA